MRNCTVITIGTKEIKIKVDEKATHVELMESLKKKMNKIKDIYEDEKLPIRFAGKILRIKEMEEVEELIHKNIETRVIFDSPKALGLHEIKKTFTMELESSDTKFHKGSIRSGMKLEYEGSLVILGDVNGGAEVIAGDNIIVIGTLRGLAHAGAKGNKKCIIAASCIEAPQLRIANIVKEVDREEYENAITRKRYAYVEESQSETEGETNEAQIVLE